MRRREDRSSRRAPFRSRLVAVATAAVAAASTAAATRALVLRLVHAQRPAAHLTPIEGAHRRFGAARIFHLDERETTGSSGLTVGDDVHRRDLSVRLEQTTQLGLRRGEGQVSYVQLLGQTIFLVALV